MVKLLYAIFANRVIEDAVTGKYSYIDIFNSVSIPKLSEYTYQSFYVAGNIIDISQGKHIIQAHIFDPDIKIINTVTFPEKLFMPGLVPFTAFFPFVKIEKIGKHRVMIFVDGKLLKTSGEFFFNVEKLA